jgi:hypothetical protein
MTFLSFIIHVAFLFFHFACVKQSVFVQCYRGDNAVFTEFFPLASKIFECEKGENLSLD